MLGVLVQQLVRRYAVSKVRKNAPDNAGEVGGVVIQKKNTCACSPKEQSRKCDMEPCATI